MKKKKEERVSADGVAEVGVDEEMDAEAGL